MLWVRGAAAVGALGLVVRHASCGVGEGGSDVLKSFPPTLKGNGFVLAGRGSFEGYKAYTLIGSK